MFLWFYERCAYNPTRFWGGSLCRIQYYFLSYGNKQFVCRICVHILNSTLGEMSCSTNPSCFFYLHFFKHIFECLLVIFASVNVLLSNHLACKTNNVTTCDFKDNICTKQCLKKTIICIKKKVWVIFNLQQKKLYHYYYLNASVTEISISF